MCERLKQDINFKICFTPVGKEIYYENGECSLKPQTAGSAAVDLRSTMDVVIYPNEMKKIPLGIMTSFDDDYVAYLMIRSGIAYKRQLTFMNNIGVIDGDYRNEWCALIKNTNEQKVEIKKGERICQFVLQRKNKANIIICDSVEDLGETDRKGGFGHTGVE